MTVPYVVWMLPLWTLFFALWYCLGLPWGGCDRILVEAMPVNRQTMVFGAVLCLVAVVSFSAWPVWTRITHKAVSAALYERTKAAVDKNPRLKPAWDIALQDDVLTWPEAKIILESAGEKVDSPE
jgi:hypothetical protein